MHLIRLFLICCLSTLTLTSTAYAQFPEPDHDYTQLITPIGTDNNKKIEVAEFFWYRCPHCYALEPALNAWIKTLPKDVYIRRIPAVLNESWTPQAKAWYAMQTMGVGDKYHDALFKAIHVDKLDSASEINLFDWAGRVGMNKPAFVNAYNSFAVQSDVMRANQLTVDAQINGVPSFVVDGQYLTSVSMTGSEQALFQTLNQLIIMTRIAHQRAQHK